MPTGGIKPQHGSMGTHRGTGKPPLGLSASFDPSTSLRLDKSQIKSALLQIDSAPALSDSFDRVELISFGELLGSIIQLDWREIARGYIRRSIYVELKRSAAAFEQQVPDL